MAVIYLCVLCMAVCPVCGCASRSSSRRSAAVLLQISHATNAGPLDTCSVSPLDSLPNLSPCHSLSCAKIVDHGQRCIRPWHGAMECGANFSFCSSSLFSVRKCIMKRHFTQFARPNRVYSKLWKCSIAAAASLCPGPSPRNTNNTTQEHEVQ